MPGQLPTLRLAQRSAPQRDLDRTIARFLTVGTYVSMVLLAVGVLLLIAAGRSPLDRGFATLDPSRIPADIAALRPEGFLWLGLLAVVATPASRVAASLSGYVAFGERTMALVSIAILAVIAASVALAVVTGKAAS